MELSLQHNSTIFEERSRIAASALVLRLLRVLRVLRISVSYLSVCLWKRSTRSMRLAGVGAMPTPPYPTTHLHRLQKGMK